MHFSCCLKSNTKTRPASVPIQIIPFAASTVGDPSTGVPRTDLAFSGPLENIWSPTVRRFVHLKESCLVSCFAVDVYRPFMLDEEEFRETDDTWEEKGDCSSRVGDAPKDE